MSAKSNQRTCIFCGRYPRRKTKEHVIPKWLIELTGEASRKVKVGFNLKDPKQLAWSFSFESFVFPSCEVCNSHFGQLECAAQKSVLAILRNSAIGEDEWTNLLDWFDKIRIGLWLGAMNLNSNPAGIQPHFHIARRVRQTDRLLAISQTEGNATGISWIGTDCPLFSFQPVCFALRINNFYFINAASHFLVSKALGLPYPESMSLAPGLSHIECNKLLKGSETYGPIFDVISNSYPRTFVAQPIFLNYLGQLDANELYDSLHAKACSSPNQRGLGRIFVSKGNLLPQVQDQEPNSDWVPDISANRDALYRHILNETHKIQKVLFGQLDWISKLSEEEIEIANATREAAIGMDLEYEKFVNRSINYSLSRQ